MNDENVMTLEPATVTENNEATTVASISIPPTSETETEQSSIPLAVNSEPTVESASSSGLIGSVQKAKVTSIGLGGANLLLHADGEELEGYVHISAMVGKNQGIVTRVADVLNVGDEVDVYVLRKNNRNRYELSMAKPPKHDWNTLKEGDILEQVEVVAVESFGSFVNIDGPKHGLIPFNLMPKGKRPKVGDIIDRVWVIEVNPSKRRIGLTMVEPPNLPWDKIRVDDQMMGKVTRLERGNAYIDIGAEKEGLVRASSLGFGVVSMNSVVSLGEEVPVRIIKVDPHKKQIDLSIEGIDTSEFSLSSGPEEMISPFAVAMQKAQRNKKRES